MICIMLTGADDIMAENDLTLSFLQCQKIFSRLALKHLFEHIEIQILTENYYAKYTQSIVPFVVLLSALLSLKRVSDKNIYLQSFSTFEASEPQSYKAYYLKP